MYKYTFVSINQQIIKHNTSHKSSASTITVDVSPFRLSTTAVSLQLVSDLGFILISTHLEAHINAHSLCHQVETKLPCVISITHKDKRIFM